MSSEKTKSVWRVATKKYYAENRSKKLDYMREYRKRAEVVERRKSDGIEKKQTNDLDAIYIAKCINRKSEIKIPLSIMPDDLIEIERVYIKTKRLLKNQNKKQ